MDGCCQRQLARWPAERAAAEEMQVQVIDRLAAFAASVDHHAVALGEPEVPGDLAGCAQQMAEQAGILP
jgi:hypothetical protein